MGLPENLHTNYDIFFSDLHRKYPQFFSSEESRNDMLFFILASSLSQTLLSCHNPSTRWPQCPPSPHTPIISEHYYHHLCSSHWPLAGDAELFCCSTCGLPAAPAQGSTGTLQILPGPRPTRAGRGE